MYCTAIPGGMDELEVASVDTHGVLSIKSEFITSKRDL